jgi:hypothetical protein
MTCKNRGAHTETILYTNTSTAIAAGYLTKIDDVVGFSCNAVGASGANSDINYPNGDKGVFIIKTEFAELDCDSSLTYVVGDSLYYDETNHRVSNVNSVGRNCGTVLVAATTPTTVKASFDGTRYAIAGGSINAISQTVTASSTILHGGQNSTIYLTAASAITLTSNPTITAGVAGQEITLVGTSDTNTITVRDNTNDAGTLLYLNSSTDFTLGKDDTLKLKCNSAGTGWVEIARSDNA